MAGSSSPPMHFPSAHPPHPPHPSGPGPLRQTKFGTTGANQFGRLPGEWNRTTGTPMGANDALTPPQTDPALQTPLDRARIAYAGMRGPITAPAAGVTTSPAAPWTGPSIAEHRADAGGEKVAVRLPGANAVDAAGPRPPSGTPAAAEWADKVMAINRDIARPHDAAARPSWVPIENPDNGPGAGNAAPFRGSTAAEVTEFNRNAPGSADSDAARALRANAGKNVAIQTPYGTAKSAGPLPSSPIPTGGTDELAAAVNAQGGPRGEAKAGPTAYQQSQIALQKQIIADHPEIGVKDSPANREFVARMADDPDQDMGKLAEQIAPKASAVASAPVVPVKVPGPNSPAAVETSSKNADGTLPVAKEALPDNRVRPTAPGMEPATGIVGPVETQFPDDKPMTPAQIEAAKSVAAKGPTQGTTSFGDALAKGNLSAAAAHAAPLLSQANPAAIFGRAAAAAADATIAAAKGTAAEGSPLVTALQSARGNITPPAQPAPMAISRPSGRPDGPQTGNPNSDQATLGADGMMHMAAPDMQPFSSPDTAMPAPHASPLGQARPSGNPDGSQTEGAPLPGAALRAAVQPVITPTHMDPSATTPGMQATHMASTAADPNSPLRQATAPGGMDANTAPTMTATHMPSNAIDPNSSLGQSVNGAQPLAQPPSSLPPHTATALGSMRPALNGDDLTPKKPDDEEDAPGQSYQSPANPAQAYA